MCDDIFIVKPFDLTKQYSNGTLKEILEKRKARNKHWKALNTVLTNYPKGLNFDIHYPYYFEKEKLLKLFNKFPIDLHYTISSMYFNMYSPVKIEKAEDNKIRNIKQAEEILQKDVFVFTTSDLFAKLKEFSTFVERIFPQPSKYE